MKPAVRAVAFVAMAGALCTSHAVVAEESAKSPAPKDTSSAMRVIVDPDTREVRAPTADELQALIEAEQAVRAAERSARASARFVAPAAPTDVLPTEKQVVRHTNGMVSVRLPQESLSLVKLETDAKGKLRATHADEVSTRLPQEDK
jgi:hypothetical protein